LVSRFGSLLVHGLPAEHESAFADRLGRIDRDSMLEAARAVLVPEAIVFIVVADAATVLERLRAIEWARTELIED
jgi:hypothetical protein